MKNKAWRWPWKKLYWYIISVCLTLRCMQFPRSVSFGSRTILSFLELRASWLRLVHSPIQVRSKKKKGKDYSGSPESQQRSFVSVRSRVIWTDTSCPGTGSLSGNLRSGPRSDHKISITYLWSCIVSSVTHKCRCRHPMVEFCCLKSVYQQWR